MALLCGVLGQRAILAGRAPRSHRSHSLVQHGAMSEELAVS